MQHGTTLTNSQSVYRRQLLKQLSKNCCFEKEHASLLIQSNQQTGGLAKEANCQETIIIDLKFRRFLSNNLSVASAIEDRECKQIVALLFNYFYFRNIQVGSRHLPSTKNTFTSLRKLEVKIESQT